MKNLISKIGISIIAIMLVFFINETITRIILFEKNKGSFKEIIGKLPQVKDGEKTTLGFIIKPSIYPKIIYELRPRINVIFFGIMRTNAQGWRSDRDFEIRKNSNTVRIMGLGDSYMFGQGCDQNLNAMSFLGELLNSNFPQKHWEIINTAVPGYNTAMEVETLKRKGFLYKPDIVIIEYIANDLDLPNFIYTDSINCLDMKRSYFFDFVTKRFKLLGKNFKLYDAPLSSTHKWRFEYDPSKVPAQYKDMVGWDAYAKAISELKILQKKYGFQVISLITWKNKNVFDFSNKAGFHTLSNDFYDPTNKDMVLGEDLHPSVKGHQKTAQLLLDFMLQQGIVSRYIKSIK